MRFCFSAERSLASAMFLPESMSLTGGLRTVMMAGFELIYETMALGQGGGN